MVIDPEGYELDAVAARMPPGAHVIEIGCGDGRLTRRYSDRVASVLAFDPDADAVAAFRAGGVPANVDLRAMPVEEFEPPHGRVDVVLFSWSL